VLRVIAAGLVAAIGSAVAAVLVGMIGKSVGVAHAQQLQAGSLASLTVLGVLVGTAGWTVISRRAANPEAVLRRLVPLVLIASWVPDLLVGLGSVSGGAALTLAVAHTAVFAVTIPLLSRLIPPATLRGAALAK
jgi:hypothetical protein